MSVETLKENVDLLEYCARREQILRTIGNEPPEDESGGVPEQMFNLIPAELEGYRTEVFYDISDMKRWLADLKFNTERGSCNSGGIKTYENYGFTDRADAKAKLLLLKQAWAGLIDVTVIDAPGEYLKVEFRLVQK